MKKAISILLVILMMAGFTGVVFAGATQQYEMPVVTTIEAAWNARPWGRTDLRVSPETFAITLHFEDGTSEVLTNWDSGPVALWWAVRDEFDPVTRTVTFTYVDTNLAYAFYGRRWLDYDDYTEAFRATLPQTSFTFPQPIAWQQAFSSFFQTTLRWFFLGWIWMR